MLDSGAALAEPDDARLAIGQRRSLGTKRDPAVALPELLDVRHVRLELNRLRAPASAPGGARTRRARARRGPAGGGDGGGD